MDEATRHAKILERYRDIYAIAQNFCEVYGAGLSAPLNVDANLLYTTVVATFDDILRYKDYHLKDPETQRSNSLKRAAYSVKWIMRFNPIIMPSAGHLSGAIPATHDSLSNAVFALHYGMVNVRLHTQSNVKLTHEFYFDLLYDVVYRNISGDSLLPVLDLERFL